MQNKRWNRCVTGAVFPCNEVRTYEEFHVCLRLAQLKDEITFKLVGFLCPDVSYLTLIIVAQCVKPQTIAGWVNGLLQFMLEQFELRAVQNAFKNRILHADSVGDAFFATIRNRRFPAAVVVLTSYVMSISMMRPPANGLSYFHRNGG